MLGHKRIPSREGGIEIVVEELATIMVTLGHKVTCYNRSGHHVSGKDFDGGKRKAYIEYKNNYKTTKVSDYLLSVMQERNLKAYTFVRDIVNIV